jgi:polar amino acid transport system substrate-binding protein
MMRFAGALFATLMAITGAQAAQLPAEIAAKKKIVIALFASFPPMAYKRVSDNKLVGLDVDLAEYFGRKLGVPVEWQEISYENAVNALTTGRVDMTLSQLNLPKSADRVDFVDYLGTSMLIYTLASHAPIPDLTDLCGKTLGANRRNGFDATMKSWSDANCVAKGKPAIAIEGTEGTPAARLSLKQGRVDATVQSSESVPYVMQQEPGVYKTVGTPISTGLMIAMTFPKTSTELRDAIKATLREAVTDGTYAAILKQHDVTPNSIADHILAQ